MCMFLSELYYIYSRISLLRYRINEISGETIFNQVLDWVYIYISCALFSQEAPMVIVVGFNDYTIVYIII